MSEKPDTVHGRLLEAVHITGYTFERACREFDWLLEDDRWKQCGPGFEQIDDFLATVNFAEFKIAIEQRKRLAKKLTDLRATQRAVAGTLGVTEATVNRDVKPVTNVTNQPAEIIPDKEIDSDVVTNVTPPPTFAHGPQDVVKLADTKTSRLKKESERENKQRKNEQLITENADPLPDVVVPTILIDPPWDWRDEKDHSQLGRGKPTYTTWPIEKIAELDIGGRATENAHLYLCITNRSLPKGFALLERWGFRYVTCLTWVKPRFGMGNYYRGQTEQVLFGVRGSLPLLRKDVGTVFNGEPREKYHSSKPEELYKLIESCSPGPWLSLFDSKRPGWHTWGILHERI